MFAQKGKDLLLKVDRAGTGNFVTVAGLRSNNLSFNSATVDVTDISSSGAWRELLAGVGVKSASIRGSGVFKDAQSDTTVREYFFNDSIRDWEVIIPDFGSMKGSFQITGFEFSGTYNGEVTCELTLESAGIVNFTADVAA